MGETLYSKFIDINIAVCFFGFWHFKGLRFNYQKADDKIFVCQFSKNIKSKLHLIENPEGKQCKSRLGGSLWATSSRSTLFANSAIFDSGT